MLDFQSCVITGTFATYKARTHRVWISSSGAKTQAIPIFMQFKAQALALYRIEECYPGIMAAIRAMVGRSRWIRRVPAVFACYAMAALVWSTPPPVRAAYNYNNRNNDDYRSDYTNCPAVISVCENSVVQVRDVTWLCNSPYAYYWGSGTHRNSRLCAYNDKITYQVSFRVTDDITEVSDIFVTMAIQEYSSRTIIQSKAPSYLCDTVGTACTSAGDYSFSFTVRLDGSASNSNLGVDTSSSSSSSDDFCPVLIMAFSTEDDSGYNLGALNMECEAWDNALATWARRAPKLTPRDWIRNYGMIFGTGLCLIVFSGFVWQQARRAASFRSCVDPCAMELDQYYNYRYPPQSIPTTIQTQESNPHRNSFNVPLHQQPTVPSAPPRPSVPQQAAVGSSK